MLSDNDKKIAQEFRKKLQEIIPIIDFKVFGSCAYGQANEESDLDVYIEVEDITLNQRQQIWDIAFNVGFEMDRIISSFVVTKEQKERGSIGASPIIFKINKEGIRL